MAIHQGNTVILRSLLAAGQRTKSSSSNDNNSTQEDHIRGYNTLLRRAVNSLSLESAECLLDCGAEIGSIQGMPCFDSVDDLRQKKAMRLIEALVEKRADINGFPRRAAPSHSFAPQSDAKTFQWSVFSSGGEQIQRESRPPACLPHST
jgi:hypothetical protein